MCVCERPDYFTGLNVKGVDVVTYCLRAVYGKEREGRGQISVAVVQSS